MKAQQTISKEPKRKPTPHEVFAERAHLIRWFHDLDTKHLKALKISFEHAMAQKGGIQ